VKKINSHKNKYNHN